MEYIILSYDLSDEDFEAERDELVDEYLEDREFDYVTAEGPVPSTLYVKEADENDNIEEIQKEFISFCEDNNLNLVNLLVAGPAPLTHHCIEEEITD